MTMNYGGDDDDRVHMVTKLPYNLVCPENNASWALYDLGSCLNTSVELGFSVQHRIVPDEKAMKQEPACRLLGHLCLSLTHHHPWKACVAPFTLMLPMTNATRQATAISPFSRNFVTYSSLLRPRLVSQVSIAFRRSSCKTE